jgi:hypothetical protein
LNECRAPLRLAHLSAFFNDFVGTIEVFQTPCAPQGSTEHEGGVLGGGLQEQASNRLKLLWSRATVVSIEEKSRPRIVAGEWGLGYAVIISETRGNGRDPNIVVVFIRQQTGQNELIIRPLQFDCGTASLICGG